MPPEARTVVVRLTAETAQYIAQMQASGRMTVNAMKPAEAAVMRQSAAIDTLGSKAGKVGLAAAAGLALMAKAAIDWESQWAGVSKTVNGTSDELDALEGDLRGLARTMPATHQEIAATAEAAGQLGVATDDVTDFTKVMVEMGSSTNLAAEDAATSIAQFMNVMQTAAGDVDEIGNTIVALGNKGASTESQITDMAQRVAGAGTTIGATESEVLGLSAAMANLGIQSELGGGAVQRVLLGINTQVASGGAKLEKYAEVAGTTADEFAQAWGDDPVRAFDMLIQGLGRVQDSGGDVASVLESMGIRGTQNLQVMLRLAGSGDMLSKSLDQSAAAWEQNDALTKEYGKRAETTASQVQVAWNRIKDAAITGGAAILPVVAEIADGVGTIADAYSALPGPIQDITTAGLAVTALLGGGLWFGAKAVRGVTDTRDALAVLRPEFSKITAPVTGYTVATRELQAAELAAGQAHARYIGTLKASSLAQELLPGRKASASMKQAIDDLNLANLRQADASKAATAAESRRAAFMNRWVPSAGRAVATVGGLSLALSDEADNMGLANTASLALMGTIAGPWGAAIGGGIGLVQDFRAASKNASGAIDGFNDSLDDTDISRTLAAFTALQDKTRSLNEDAHDLSGLGDFFGDSMAGWADVFGTGANDLNDASDQSIEKLTNLTGVLQGVAQANNDFIVSADNGLQNLPYGNLEDLTRIATKAQPVLEDLGYSVQDLMSMKPGSAEATRAVQEINDALAHADSQEGRVEALGDAIGDLGSDMDSTADQAKSLGEALDALLDPGLDLSAATDEWTAALRHFDDDLAKNNRTLKGNSDAAIKNREAVRDRVGQIKDLLVAEANAGQSSEQMARSLRSQRKALIDAGEAAGISRKEMRDYLDTIGLTPDLVRTVIQADTGQAMSAMDKVKAMLDRLDGTRAQTVVETVYQQTNKPKSLPGRPGGFAGGGYTGPGAPDDVAGVVHGREYVMDAETTQNALPLLEAIHASKGRVFGYAAGGQAGKPPGPRRTLDDRLAIAQALQEIHDLSRQIRERIKDGKHKGDFATRGIDRSVLELQLKAARADLRAAQRKDAREARETTRAVAQAKQGFSLTAGLAPVRDLTAGEQAAAATRDALKDFARDVREAGGKVGKNFSNLSTRAVVLSTRYADNAEKLTQLNAQIASVRDAAAGSFMNDAFSGSLAGFDRVVGKDTTDANAMTAALATAAGKGLDGPLAAALAGSGNVRLAESFAQMSAAEIQSREAAFAARESAGKNLGDMAVSVSGLAQQVTSLTAQNQEMLTVLRNIQTDITDGAAAAGAAFGREINGTASGAVRGRPPSKTKGAR